MPLYEYECTACHRRIEKIQKFSDAELTVCPHCSGRLERTITAAAVSFKGGGWFKDGYGSVKPPSASSNDSAASNDSASSSDSAPSSASAPSTSTSTEAAKPASTPAPAPASAPAASTSSKD